MKKEWWLAGWGIAVFLTLFHTASIFSYEIKTPHNRTTTLESYRGKVTLVVNTASHCKYTPQLSGLEKLYRTYRSRGFEVIGFPSNQLHPQETLSGEEIKHFFQHKYGVTFPIFGKTDVNSVVSGFNKKESIEWNFTKYLIDRNGLVIRRYSPRVRPEEIAADIEKIL